MKVRGKRSQETGRERREQREDRGDEERRRRRSLGIPMLLLSQGTNHRTGAARRRRYDTTKPVEQTQP